MTTLEEAVSLFNQLDHDQKIKELARLSAMEKFKLLTEENKAKVIAKIEELLDVKK